MPKSLLQAAGQLVRVLVEYLPCRSVKLPRHRGSRPLRLQAALNPNDHVIDELSPRGHDDVAVAKAPQFTAIKGPDFLLDSL